MAYKPDLGGIPVNSDSVVASWARWCARGGRRSLDALDVGGRPQMAFVPDEVLVDDGNPELVEHLVKKYRAEVVPPRPIPPVPTGMKPLEGVKAEGMPVPVRLRLSTPPPTSERAASLLRDAFDARASVTSEHGARVLGLVAVLAADQMAIGLNVVGQGASLPLFNAVEGADVPYGSDPFAWPAYAKRARVVAAWQLVEAYRKFGFTKRPVTVGILDGGFWLDGWRPAFDPAFQSGSDFGASVMALNLLDEGVGAGGASPIKCHDGYSCPWHGNGVASVAVAPVGNALGAAGVGGTVAQPVMFKSALDIDQVIRCLAVCLAWGVDVLNMSFSIARWEAVFPTTAWNKAFQFAADNGLIMVASAGNDSERLPDDNNPRPATRTPGTITVGCLNENDDADWKSNFGSSVDIWAPGTNLPVMPDPNNPKGSTISGTSAAAPFVSGVVAMMRAVNGSLDTFQAKQILTSSGWRGSGKVSVGVDAFAAVLAAMGGRLPADKSERNDSPSTASELLPLGSHGAFVPFGDLATLSDISDQDWYQFRVDTFSRLNLELRWYPLLGPVQVSLEPDDSESRANRDITAIHARGATTYKGDLAPGNYRLHVRGSMNLYELRVTLDAILLEPDLFEHNDSFEKATRFRLPRVPPDEFASVRFELPGTYDLTIQPVNDHDFFRVDVLGGALISVPTVRVQNTDEPLDITVYDADRAVIKRATGIRSIRLVLPLGATSFVEISARRPSRYQLTVRNEVDPAVVPRPFQEELVFRLPDPGDPPFTLEDEVTNFLVDLEREQRLSGTIVLASIEEKPLQMELLNSAGNVVIVGERQSDGVHEAIALNVSDLAPDAYVLRLSRSVQKLPVVSGQHNVERLPLLPSRLSERR